MRKIILVVHTSLDGFVAYRNGELMGFDRGEENLQFVCKLTKTADTALFGRISYKLLNDYWPSAKDNLQASKGEIAFSNWYNTAQKIVVSKSMKGAQLNNTTIISHDVLTELQHIKEKSGKDILIFGSPSIAQMLLSTGLINSYWVFINPVIFGEGIALFKIQKDKIKLKLVAKKQFGNGELGLNYNTEH